jgi:hypothetical protein
MDYTIATSKNSLPLYKQYKRGSQEEGYQKGYTSGIYSGMLLGAFSMFVGAVAVMLTQGSGRESSRSA